MNNTGARYTVGEISEIIYEGEDRILESIRDYIVDNLNFDNVGDLDFDSERFFDEPDTRILFNLDTEEIYDYKIGTDMGDYMDGLVENGKVVGVYDINMESLAAYIEHEMIIKSEDHSELVDTYYKERKLTKEEYSEEIGALIYDRYIEDYMNKARLTVEYLNSLD